MDIVAKWIWRKQKDYRSHNRHVLFRKTVRLSEVRGARMAVTADTRYRLFINGEWVADGPCRSWPLHYQYDILDVGSYLKPGDNEIRILGHFFGIGTFHQAPQQAGLLAQLEVVTGSRKPMVIATDATWQTAEAPGWLENTPKISVQMGPVEIYDARREKRETWSKPVELYAADEGPWKDLHPRDTALLTRRPVAFRRFLGASFVDCPRYTFSFPLKRIAQPTLTQVNHSISGGGGVATHIVVRGSRTRIRVNACIDRARVDGRASRDGVFQLEKGRHLLTAAVEQCFSHTNYQLNVQIDAPENVRLENPIHRDHENPWVYVDFMRDRFTGNDLVHTWHPEPDRDAYRREYEQRRDEYLCEVVDAATLKSKMDRHAMCLSLEEMVMPHPHLDFLARRVGKDAIGCVEAPEALMDDNAACTVVRPSGDDVELVYDLGDQVCGYWELEAVTEEPGVVFDIFAIEYIAPNGAIQHTHNNHNGLRYTAGEGLNRFTSLERRSGRYVYMTIRGAKRPVRIRRLGVVESTYPVAMKAAFRCSDPSLDRIWDISARTLQLCMEDTFTDCPLYEQTLWVGDARNESLYALDVFGAEDLVRRCIRLAGQSLDHFPVVGCQVPSAWEVLLPAWSFLWGISVWDYYFYSGDKAFLREVWPWVCENLRNARTMTDEHGLFSAPYWNMFDWSGTDDRHRTVTHNSQLLVGAIDAAIRCADVLGRKKDLTWLRRYRKETVEAVNNLWDSKKNALPDSVYESGKASDSISIHNCFLGILYDVLDGKRAATARKHMVSPPEGMVCVGSPFALQYHFEALEKAGCEDVVLQTIRAQYERMIRLGATTVWETFAGDEAGRQFPTRSHCHAWSSAPLSFLNRIILGIRPLAVGASKVEISPYVSDLKWAEGATNTVRGPVRVEWHIDGRELHITSSVPDGVQVRFQRNATHKGLVVFHNGRRLSGAK